MPKLTREETDKIARKVIYLIKLLDNLGLKSSVPVWHGDAFEFVTRNYRKDDHV